MEANHVGRDVELFGQHALHALAHGARCQPRGVAADVGLAAGGGRPAVGRQVGVHHQHAYILEGQAQFFSGAGGQHADEILPHFGAAGADLGAAGGVDFHLGLGLVRRAAPQAGVLVAGGKTPGVDFAAGADGRKEIGRLEIGDWRGAVLRFSQSPNPPIS